MQDISVWAFFVLGSTNNWRVINCGYFQIVKSTFGTRNIWQYYSTENLTDQTGANESKQLI